MPIPTVEPTALGAVVVAVADEALKEMAVKLMLIKGKSAWS